MMVSSALLGGRFVTLTTLTGGILLTYGAIISLKISAEARMVKSEKVI